MTNEQIRKELKEMNIVDNPFDTMMYNSMELCRTLLFSCVRFKNPDIPENIRCDDRSILIDKYINDIETTYDKLMELSEDTITMLRQTSYFTCNYYDKFQKLNDTLNDMRKLLETLWTRCNPNRNDEYEKIRLGEDSKEYKRLLELREIADNSQENRDYWYNLIDIYSRPDECIAYNWNTKEEVKEKQKFIKKHNLTVDDIYYIIAYKFNE